MQSTTREYAPSQTTGRGRTPLPVERVKLAKHPIGEQVGRAEALTTFADSNLG
jgi:hypothetical protein